MESSASCPIGLGPARLAPNERAVGPVCGVNAKDRSDFRTRSRRLGTLAGLEMSYDRIEYVVEFTIKDEQAQKFRELAEACAKAVEENEPGML